ESVIERDLQRLRCTQRAIRQRFLEELDVVVVRGNVALQQRVDVRIDQSGQQRHVAEVDDLHASGNGTADRLDLVATYDDHRGRDDLTAASVDEARRTNGDESLWSIGREERR